MAKKSTLSIAERIFRRSKQEGECLIWQGATAGKHKYGQIKVGRKMLYCHRLSYQIHKGEIPDGMVVMHTCDRPRCVNPDHLVAGTQAENVADMHAKGRAVPTIGTINGKAVLTEDAVQAIRRRYKRYCRINGAGAIAKEYGVTTQAIYSALSGRNWACVD